MKKILTVSSANMDFVMNVARVPNGGETLIERGKYGFVPGGKGANAAITVARLGGESIFCTRLGKDANGDALLALYKSEGINTEHIRQDGEYATGLAAISVEVSGQNRISVFPGANDAIEEADIDRAFEAEPEALFMQLEISHKAIIHAARRASERNIPIFIDAGPADKSFPLDKLPSLEVFSPNESETEIFAGIYPDSEENCLKAATVLSGLVSARYYIIKLGGRGAYIYDGEKGITVSTHDVKCVDTTAAGDAFTSSLTLEYLKSGDILHSVKYANAVGSLVVSKEGASTSIPTFDQVDSFVSCFAKKS